MKLQVILLATTLFSAGCAMRKGGPVLRLGLTEAWQIETIRGAYVTASEVLIQELVQHDQGKLAEDLADILPRLAAAGKAIKHSIVDGVLMGGAPGLENKIELFLEVAHEIRIIANSFDLDTQGILKAIEQWGPVLRVLSPFLGSDAVVGISADLQPPGGMFQPGEWDAIPLDERADAIRGKFSDQNYLEGNAWRGRVPRLHVPGESEEWLAKLKGMVF